MNEDTKNAIAVLADKIRNKEDELNKLKRVVNGLCADEGEQPLYANVGSDSATLQSLRSDLFYGETLSRAARAYLEMRKASGLGAATVNDIYAALKAGGYKFETASEENAKTGVRISLRKSSATFHKLPNGEYGLSAWYGVKAQDEADSRSSRKKSAKRKAKQQKEEPLAAAAPPAKGDSGDSKPAKSPANHSPSNGHQTGSGTDEIEKLLASEPLKTWSKKEILARVPRLKESSLPTLLSRLKLQGRAEKAGRGLWKLAK